MKTLIAEDDSTSRAVLSGVLKKMGHDVIETVNGAEAWESMQRPDAPLLLILDWMMPGMDGQEALKTIRAQENEAGIMDGDGVKVVMTTALGDSRNVMQAFRESCDAYVVKPIDKEKAPQRTVQAGVNLMTTGTSPCAS